MDGDRASAALILMVGFGIYFLPAICAISRHCRGRGAIVFLNLLLGWTAVGWIVTFIWANAAPKE